LSKGSGTDQLLRKMQSWWKTSTVVCDLFKWISISRIVLRDQQQPVLGSRVLGNPKPFYGSKPTGTIKGNVVRSPGNLLCPPFHSTVVELIRNHCRLLHPVHTLSSDGKSFVIFDQGKSLTESLQSQADW